MNMYIYWLSSVVFKVSHSCHSYCQYAKQIRGCRKRSSGVSFVPHISELTQELCGPHDQTNQAALVTPPDFSQSEVEPQSMNTRSPTIRTD